MGSSRSSFENYGTRDDAEHRDRFCFEKKKTEQEKKKGAHNNRSVESCSCLEELHSLGSFLIVMAMKKGKNIITCLFSEALNFFFEGHWER